MAKSKQTTDVTAEPATTATATVAARLAERLAEARRDWESLVAESAMLGIGPPNDVIDDLGRRLDFDQPRFQFRHAVEGFKTAVHLVQSCDRKRKVAEGVADELGPRGDLIDEINAAENALADARRRLKRLDHAGYAASVPRGQLVNVLREHEEHFTPEAVVTAAGCPMPEPKRKTRHEG